MIPVHVPVMPEQVVEYLCPQRSGALIVDGTLGDGGHSEIFLSTAPECRVIGIDADALMGGRAHERLQLYSSRFELKIGWNDEVFSRWDDVAPDVVLLDLGISSFHYRERGKGFSFAVSEPLDMRLADDQKLSASDIVNGFDEEELANLIYQYGEERYSRRIARRILERRSREKITDSSVLADIIFSAVPPAARYKHLHPATRTFQALRIAVNRELERLASLLKTVPEVLAPGAVFGVISFHSLEDRMVKYAFRDMDDRFEVLTRKPLVPHQDECRQNPAARSAKFRVLRKILKEGDG